MKTIDVENAFKLDNVVFVDVRSPLEFEEDRIIGSVNMPLLNNEERKIVGTLYKQEGKEVAIEKGLEYTGKKLNYFYSELQNLSKEYKNIIVYCARGGMRSKSIVNFFSALDIQLYQLEGGHKSYRNYVMNFFENANKYYEFIVLHGLTGVGKTDALKCLQENQIPALDLEECAKNSGSVFGHVYFKDAPPSQKLFESLIFNYINKSKSKYIFIESESRRIGGVLLPDSIYDMIISKGYHILLESSAKARVKRLVYQYVSSNHKDDSILISSLEKLRKRLGNEKINYLIEKTNLKEYNVIATELILNYYDPLYNYSIDQYEYEYKLNTDNLDDAMANLINFYKGLIERSFN